VTSQTIDHSHLHLILSVSPHAAVRDASPHCEMTLKMPDYEASETAPLSPRAALFWPDNCSDAGVRC